jgi:glycosyltransferase involved in cell wall biosynthesis
VGQIAAVLRDAVLTLMLHLNWSAEPMAEIEIAIPAYNCAAWLDALIESILQQGFDNWRIIARNDASTDDTAACLADWKSRLGERMIILPPGPNLGLVGNYEAILGATTAQWVMFADADDIWLPGKMSITLGAMRTAEADQGAATPIVVFTDAKVVDEDLRPIADSYWRWTRANLAASSVFRRLVVDSPAISSALMVNRALINLALPMEGAAYADWWSMLVAAAFGKVVMLDECTILYRRHSNNLTSDPYIATIRGALCHLFASPDSAHQKINQLLRKLASQAGAFAQRFQHQLSAADLATLQAASCLPRAGGLGGRWFVVRHRLWFGSPIKNAGLMLFM